MTRTHKNFSPIDSINLHFSSSRDPVNKYVYFLNKRSFLLEAEEAVEDFSYIITNNITMDKDTISEVSFNTVQVVEDCGSCFLIKESKKCNAMVDKKVKVNQKVIEGFDVIIQ